MCKNFKGANTYRTFYECEYKIDYQFTFKTSEFYLIIVAIILVFSLIIIYYNNYLIRKKQKPVKVPSVLPEALFPNDNSINIEYQKMKNEDNNMETMTYTYNNI